MRRACRDLDVATGVDTLWVSGTVGEQKKQANNGRWGWGWVGLGENGWGGEREAWFVFERWRSYFVAAPPCLCVCACLFVLARLCWCAEFGESALACVCWCVCVRAFVFVRLRLCVCVLCVCVIGMSPASKITLRSEKWERRPRVDLSRDRWIQSPEC